MEENKTYVITVRGKEMEVSEAVYRAYVRPRRAEQRAKRRDWRCPIKGKGNYMTRCKEDCMHCPYGMDKPVGNKLSLDALKEVGWDRADENQDPEIVVLDQIEKEEQRKKLYAAIKQLKPRYQFIIKEVYLEEKTQKEVAAKLGITEGTLSVTISRIMEKLKNIIKNS